MATVEEAGAPAEEEDISDEGSVDLENESEEELEDEAEGEVVEAAEAAGPADDAMDVDQEKADVDTAKSAQEVESH